MRLIDMHCHLDLMTNGTQIAHEAREREIGFFCTTVTPEDAVAAAERFDGCANVRVGIGLHPWWIADGTCGDAEVEHAELLVRQARFIGEIGLDASKRGAASLDAQRSAFHRIVRAAARHPVQDRVLSIHAIRAVTPLLDELEGAGLTRDASCIIHWFSGTSDELWRAVRMGCRFSINEHMLATKRGREYARILPEESLLLETDAPPELHAPYSLDAIERSLTKTLKGLAELRRCNCDELARSIAERSSRLLSL